MQTASYQLSTFDVFFIFGCIFGEASAKVAWLGAGDEPVHVGVGEVGEHLQVDTEPECRPKSFSFPG